MQWLDARGVCPNKRVGLRHYRQDLPEGQLCRYCFYSLTLTLTDTGGAVLTLMLGYRPGGELP